MAKRTRSTRPTEPAPMIPAGPLRVRKYANRRLYDQSTSRHLTGEQLYDLVAAGHDVTIVDARTEEDITNVVLAQLLIERDPLKLATVPSGLLHTMIRTNERMLQSAVSQFLGSVASSMAHFQRPSGYGFPVTMPASPATGMPAGLEWLAPFMPPFARPPGPTDAPSRGTQERASDDVDSIAGLRDEIEQLRARLDEIGGGGQTRKGRSSARRSSKSGSTGRSASAGKKSARKSGRSKKDRG